MSKTIAEVASSVLRKHGRLPGNQVARPGQLKIVTDEYEDLYNRLFANSNVNWSETDPVPDGVVSPIKNLLLGMTADDFASPNKWGDPEYIKIQEKMIAKFLASPYVYQPTPYSYF